VTLVGWLFLILVLVVVGVFIARQQRPKARPRPTPRVSGASDELGSLGLSEVRPAQPRDDDEPADSPAPIRRSAPIPPRSAESPRQVVRSETDATPSMRGADGVLGGPRPARPRVPTSITDDGPWDGPAVPHLLASLAAHVGGSVAVVRHDGEAFAVEARSDGGPLTPVRGRPILLDGPSALGPDDLITLSALVGDRARAYPLGDRVVLVGGAGREADRYVDLLAALTPGAELVEHYADFLGDLQPVDPDLEARTATPVPRATIIAQEQDAARADGRPLAFALVTLADAEERLTQGTPEVVSQAEAALRSRLAEADGVRRVEPFGDLLFGVFLDLRPKGTAAWCDTLASGDPPLFIGAVAPADGAPNEIRDAAASALRDAYDQRRARVVEV